MSKSVRTDLNEQQNLRVLFFSTITVSPAQGGGHAVFNALEPSPAGSEAFYATPTNYPAHWPLFPELSSRVCWYRNDNRPFPVLRGGRVIPPIRWLNKLTATLNDRIQKRTIVKHVLRCIQHLEIDVLLLCPQDDVDLAAAVNIARISKLPSVLWVMDNYYTQEPSATYIRQLWKMSRRHFVASESMQRDFLQLYGGDCEMLNNSVPFPKHYPEPTDKGNVRLRIVYAGAMHSYYVDSVSKALREIQSLGDEVSLDIYSPDDLPIEWRLHSDVPWHRFPPLARDELLERLQEYDVLLLLSSFKPEHRELAATSQAGKMADYLAAGRCILVYGPSYADNVRYAQRHDFGEIVTSQAPGALKEAILRLAHRPAYRSELGKKAYYFGREHRDKEVYSTRLWRALSEAVNSSKFPSRGA